MFHYDYLTKITCSQIISLDLDEGNVVRNISFMGGCNGNLKTISMLLDGQTADEIEGKLGGITCGRRPTSCADQLAKAVRAAVEASTDPNYKPLGADDDDDEEEPETQSFAS